MRLCHTYTLLLVLTGCSGQEPTKPQATNQPTAPLVSPSSEAVTLQVVKWDSLTAAIEKQKGNIVVLDVWATWCVPCKAEFPHLVELHQHYGKDGVACVSVTVDKPRSSEAALKFLREKGATFANYLLDEEDDFWQTKWGLNGIPAVFVYGRDGKLATKFDLDKPFTYADVEKRVKELLAK